MHQIMKYIYIWKLKYNDKIECKRTGENTWKIWLTMDEHYKCGPYYLSPKGPEY